MRRIAYPCASHGGRQVKMSWYDETRMRRMALVKSICFDLIRPLFVVLRQWASCAAPVRRMALQVQMFRPDGNRALRMALAKSKGRGLVRPPCVVLRWSSQDVLV